MTLTLCDYPGCRQDATWKIELESLPTATLGDLLGQPPRRNSMDVCNEHLPHVTFDSDQIAEFDAAEARKRGAT